MKALILFLFAINILPLFAKENSDEEFLLDMENIKHGGMIAPVMKFTEIAGEPALMLGGRIGWIINHDFTLGAGAYTMVSGNPQADTIDPYLNKKPSLMVTQVGLEMEYVINPEKMFHYSFMLHIGAGNVLFSLNNTTVQHEDDTYNSSLYNPDYGQDWYFVIEPQVHVIANITKWFRAGLGVSYRFARGVDYRFSVESLEQDYTYDANDIKGPSAILTLKFGMF